MPNIHIHVFDKKHLMTTVLCDEFSIESKPPRLSLFIALHSVASYYGIPTAPDFGNSTQFFSGCAAPYFDKFDSFASNKDKINYACTIINKPAIF